MYAIWCWVWSPGLGPGDCVWLDQVSPHTDLKGRLSSPLYIILSLAPRSYSLRLACTSLVGPGLWPDNPIAKRTPVHHARLRTVPHLG